jgi:hypothetical protein
MVTVAINLNQQPALQPQDCMEQHIAKQEGCLWLMWLAAQRHAWWIREPWTCTSKAAHIREGCELKARTRGKKKGSASCAAPEA